MTDTHCPHCGIPRIAPAGECAACGQAAAPVPTLRRLPLFPVATHKFILLSLCTFGLYQLYWCQQNWQRLKDASGERLSPMWRASLAPLWGFSLFERIHAQGLARGVDVRWSATLLAACYLTFSILQQLPDTFQWMSLAALLPMLPVQQTTQLINAAAAADLDADGARLEPPNDTYGVGNLATILVGGLVAYLLYYSSDLSF